MDQALPARMLLVAAALLLTNYPAAQAAVKTPQLSSADDLVDWVVKYGGQVGRAFAARHTLVYVSKMSEAAVYVMNRALGR